MMSDIYCSCCSSAIDKRYMACSKCGTKIKLVQETHISNQANKIKLADYRIGESVVIINNEHPLYDHIALICGKRHMFVRLEVNGLMIWMPNDWVKRYE